MLHAWGIENAQKIFFCQKTGMEETIWDKEIGCVCEYELEL
jgi:hypothetical protein